MRWRPPAFVRELFAELSAHKIGRLAAALAYFAIFALPGLLLFVTWVAGAIYGFDAVQSALRAQVGALAGRHGGDVVRDMLQNADPMRQGSWTGRGIAIAGVLAGATGFFVQFQDALDSMWAAKAPPRGGWLVVVGRRALSIGMLGTIALLLVASLAASAALAALGRRVGLGGPEATWVVEGATALVSVALLSVLFAGVFKFVPRIKVDWREVWTGAVVTAVLVVLGKALIGLYLGRRDPGAAYGAAAPIAILLAWLYYFSLIVLVGAEFTQVYARLHGPRRAERAARLASIEAHAAPGERDRRRASEARA